MEYDSGFVAVGNHFKITNECTAFNGNPEFEYESRTTWRTFPDLVESQKEQLEFCVIPSELPCLELRSLERRMDGCCCSSYAQ